jgi:uncharacterized protein DUF4192
VSSTGPALALAGPGAAATLPGMTSECTLKVRSAADLINAVPYLIGFHPADSIAVVATRSDRVIFAGRHDLPPPEFSAERARAAAQQLAEVVVRQDADAAAVIGYGEPPQVGAAVLRTGEALRQMGLVVLEELRVADGRYWSYSCTTPRCCPPEGRPCAPEQSPVAASATFAGQVALPDREAFVAQIAAVVGEERAAMTAATARAQARLADLLDRELHEANFARLVRRAGRTAVRDAERHYRSGRRLSDNDAAWLGVLLIDTPVRDYAWERTGLQDWRLALWTDVLRRVEPAYVPAPACLLSFAAWRLGMGALASAAMERALAQEPQYPMAKLLEEALGYGLSPAYVKGWPSIESPGGQKPRRSFRRRAV